MGSASLVQDDNKLLKLNRKLSDQLDMNLSDLQWVRTLGVGSFARVELVKRAGGKLVALKMVRKELLDDNKVAEQMEDERRLMKKSGARSRFVVAYHGTFASTRFQVKSFHMIQVKIHQCMASYSGMVHLTI